MIVSFFAGVFRKNCGQGRGYRIVQVVFPINDSKGGSKKMKAGVESKRAKPFGGALLADTSIQD